MKTSEELRASLRAIDRRSYEIYDLTHTGLNEFN